MYGVPGTIVQGTWKTPVPFPGIGGRFQRPRMRVQDRIESERGHRRRV